ncbi:hypothetical protein GXW83_01070 [Streptacidiphilus sp. PB12-B1b]|uniref:hypothetical protein n=1 Tax=Streptacidiphilus sp. PB12-B1b TaxID=2705012 RepID=UPI0015FAAD2C|nr:hypothetical protein [Streptacidiphilus sp. PB12-B1b]QMU74583.1 hypothetical protein GXW83_01070 [Streptacidiphilus sp. PB12-B1b]
MNGELAQYFALATHGSAWLQDSDVRTAPALDQSNSTFQFVRTVTFAGVPGTGPWLKKLAARGVDRIWLAAPGRPSNGGKGLEAHIAAAFAGGMQAGLLTTGRRGSELWRASWEAGDPAAADHRVWDIHYRCDEVTLTPDDFRIPVADASSTLDSALEAAVEFSQVHGLRPWDSVFVKARALLGADTFEDVYHQDLFPEGRFDLASRRLAAAAQSAWVFGGMGSWNDLGFADAETHTEYERLSRELFSAVTQSCLAAANVPLTGEEARPQHRSWLRRRLLGG